jgi:beta-aspartyl-peptidase (threonine type)
MTDTPPSRDWKLVVHGGAGVIERSRMTPELERQYRAGLDAALDAGGAVLGKSGSAVDAVEAAARALEDNPLFNAGRGAVLTYEGETELDAAIMEGSKRDAGAVAGASNSKNPISLARAVMEHSPHVFLGSKGADQFAQEAGLEQAPPGYFDLPERRRQLEELKANNSDWFDVDMKFGTIGAVARDAEGHLAAATSTGGITGKRWGRIGDSPLIGAGTWADDRSCAVSATGSGEYFIRAAVAHEIASRIRHLGESPQAAADAVMAEVKELGGNGGVIVVSATGETVYSFNSEGMYRGTASPGGRSIAIYGDE